MEWLFPAENDNQTTIKPRIRSIMDSLFSNNTQLLDYVALEKQMQASIAMFTATSSPSVAVSTIVKGFPCVQQELSEPDFLRYACSGHPVAAWIATIFLLSMICFGFIKCMVAHGPCNLYDLRRTEISFPKRPELLVLLCSSLPTVFVVLTRPLFDADQLHYKTFVRGWGLAQTRFFFDLFTRTASIYHLVYWAYRTPLIKFLWRLHLTQQHLRTLWVNRPKPKPKPVVPKHKPSGSTATSSKVKSKPVRSGRTREYGYQHKSTSSTGKVGRSGEANKLSNPNSAKGSIDGHLDDGHGPEERQLSSKVVNAGNVSVIAPQPLFIGQSNMMMMMNVNTGYPTPAVMPAMGGSGNASPYMGQLQYQSPAFGNMFAGSMTQLPGQTSEFMPSMGYGMNFNMSMGMPMGMLGGMGQPQVANHTGANTLAPPLYQPVSEAVPNEKNNSMLNISDRKSVGEPEPKVKVQFLSRLNKAEAIPTRSFSITCKRVIPTCIYFVALVITLPSGWSFVRSDEKDFSAAKCTTSCRSYFYYDFVMLVTIPTILIVVAFYHGALSKVQLNGGTKMTYRLRCYYVTFILLNIPLFVTMLTSIGFRLSGREYQSIYGTGILIAVTAYHANFALKATVYTTGCNCICCSQTCLLRCNWLNRFIIYFTTPVASKDQEALLDGVVISVPPESEKLAK